MAENGRGELRSGAFRPLFDVVNRAVEQPLGVDLRLAAQGEAIYPFVVSQVSKYGLHYMHPPPVDLLGFGKVDLEQQPRVVGLLAGLVVAVALLESLEPDAAVDEVVDGVLERAGEQLLLQVDRHHQILSVVVFLVPSHAVSNQQARGGATTLYHFPGLFDSLVSCLFLLLGIRISKMQNKAQSM